MTLNQKRLAVDPGHNKIPIVRQCELLDLARSSLYYTPCQDTDYNERLMRLLDEQYMKTPCYGVDKMTAWLRREGYPVNPKRTRRLLRLMGLEAIYPHAKHNLSEPNKEHKIFPYLLRGVTVDHVNQVWSMDITYIRMHHGWVYLTAVIDWYSRYVLSWEVSVTLEPFFCIDTLKRADWFVKTIFYYFLDALLNEHDTNTKSVTEGARRATGVTLFANPQTTPPCLFFLSKNNSFWYYFPLHPP